ncbi:MAG: 30S ribosomal protein S4 [Candidatus Saganbacteria bacterium]|nr:30S ribosomal protein S4 [Candidatus Saganbacteria bacterium]
MGRHTEAKCKLCRRQGEKLFLKGEKCSSAKCVFDKRPYAPGQHGKLPIKISEYGLRLREKQKARRIYGLNEGQFRRYFEIASQKKGDTGEKLLEFLERRLDNVVYRSGCAVSRSQARQVVRYGHVLVGGKKVNIPSFAVKLGDLITFKPKMAEKVKVNLEKMEDKSIPDWISVNGEKQEITIEAIPTREDIDSSIAENLIVEFYSR